MHPALQRHRMRLPLWAVAAIVVWWIGTLAYLSIYHRYICAAAIGGLWLYFIIGVWHYRRTHDKSKYLAWDAARIERGETIEQYFWISFKELTYPRADVVGSALIPLALLILSAVI